MGAGLGRGCGPGQKDWGYPIFLKNIYFYFLARALGYGSGILSFGIIQALQWDEQTQKFRLQAQCAASVVVVALYRWRGTGQLPQMCRILVPRPGIELSSPALGRWILSHREVGVIFPEELPTSANWAHTGTISRKQIHKSAWPRVWSLPNPVKPQVKERFWQGVGQVSPLSVCM